MSITTYDGCIMTASEKISFLIRDAMFAQKQYEFAAKNSYRSMSVAFCNRALALRDHARVIYLANPGSEWPECEWPAPSFQIAEGPHD